VTALPSEATGRLLTADEAIARIKAGGVGVLPCDTVYGLVASAHDPEAVARLYALKRRNQKPGTIIAASVEQLVGLGFAAADLAPAAKWWPNPLSVVLPAGEQLFYLHQGLASLPVRIPKDERVRAIVAQTGPLSTSSVNQPGEPESVDMAMAWDYFGDSVDFYVDGGNLAGRAASTIVRFDAAGKAEVLREGAIKASYLAS